MMQGRWAQGMQGEIRNPELLVAFHRFGFGIRPGADDMRAIAKDPRGFVAAE
ncbi:MAG: hypothetical protein JWN93_2266, partial [Hyphomicrobiales bacterium]|nr:hypothetical protein [Hyphomicrobiales bacterium]